MNNNIEIRSRMWSLKSTIDAVVKEIRRNWKDKPFYMEFMLEGLEKQFEEVNQVIKEKHV